MGFEAQGERADELRELRRGLKVQKCSDQKEEVLSVFLELGAILFLSCGEQNLGILNDGGR
jgi:hypothetical protein